LLDELTHALILFIKAVPALMFLGVAVLVALRLLGCAP